MTTISKNSWTSDVQINREIISVKNFINFTGVVRLLVQPFYIPAIHPYLKKNATEI